MTFILSGIFNWLSPSVYCSYIAWVFTVHYPNKISVKLVFGSLMKTIQNLVLWVRTDMESIILYSWPDYRQSMPFKKDLLYTILVPFCSLVYSLSIRLSSYTVRKLIEISGDSLLNGEHSLSYKKVIFCLNR